MVTQDKYLARGADPCIRRESHKNVRKIARGFLDQLYQLSPNGNLSLLRPVLRPSETLYGAYLEWSDSFRASILGNPHSPGPVSMHRTGLAVFAEVLRGLFSEVRIAKQRLSSRKITHLHHDSASLGYVACSVVCSRSATTQRGKVTMGGERPNARRTGRK